MNDPNQKVADFQPKSLDGGQVEVRAFRPKSLHAGVVPDYSNIKKQFGSLANTDPNAPSHFTLHPDSKKFLGVEEAEREHLESLVREEVDKRVGAIRTQAHDEGFQQGLIEGRAKAEADFSAEMTPIFERFRIWLQECETIKEDLYEANERLMIQIIVQIGKQVLLRELRADPDYMKRLCVEVIDKVGAKDYVRIQVNSEDFANMEQLKEFLKMEFPDLKNIQFEVTDDLPMGGCKVETDLSRINAGIDIQLKSIEATLGKL